MQPKHTHVLQFNSPEELVEKLLVPVLRETASSINIRQLPQGLRVELLELLLALLAETRWSFVMEERENGLWPHVVLADPGAYHRGKSREELEAERNRIREELRRGALEAGAELVDDPKQRELEDAAEGEAPTIEFLRVTKEERH